MAKELITDTPIIIKPGHLAAELSVLLNLVSVDATGGTKELQFVSVGLEGHKVSVSASWLTATCTASVITLTVQPNSGERREAAVTLTAYDSTGFPYTETVSVVQASAYESGISITVPKELNLPHGKTTGEFEIEGEYDTVTVSLATDWIRAWHEDGKIRYTCNANTSTNRRAAVMTLVFALGGDERLYSVYITQQSAASEKRIILTNGNRATVGYQEGKTVIPFTTENTVCDSITCDADWVSLSVIQSDVDNQAFSPLTVAYTKNTGSETRQAAIFFKSGNDTLAEFTLSQFGEAASVPTGSIAFTPARIGAEDTQGLIQLFPVNIDIINESLETDVDWIHSDDGENGNHIGGKGETTVLVRPDGWYILFVCYPNNTGKERTGNIILKSVDTNGNIIKTEIPITQERYVPKVFNPIWKSTVMTVTGEPGSPVYWALTGNGKTLHQARAIFGADGKANVRLNGLLTPYMKSRIDFNAIDASQDTGGFISGTFAVLTDGEYLANTVYSVWNDCSYIDGYTPAILNDPIELVYDSRQYVPFTFISKSGSLQAQITKPIQRMNDRNAKIVSTHQADDGIVTVLANPVYNESYPHNWMRLDVNNESLTFELKDTCATHCLYYLNKFGGIDSLLVRGKVRKSDAITATTADFGNGATVLRKDITRSWRVYTHYLTDSQCERMDSLIESTLCYLQNLETGEILPVNVSNAEMEFKTHKDGTRPYYEITLEEKKERTRL